MLNFVLNQKNNILVNFKVKKSKKIQNLLSFYLKEQLLIEADVNPLKRRTPARRYNKLKINKIN